MYPLTPHTRQKALKVFTELDTERLLEIVKRTPQALLPRHALSELQMQVEKDLQDQKEMFDPNSQEAKDERNKANRQGFELTRAVRSKTQMPMVPLQSKIGSTPEPRQAQQEPELRLGASVPGGVDMKPMINRREPAKRIADEVILNNQYGNESIADEGGGAGSGLPF